MQGVGPNIAISFCVYESLKSAWECKRYIVDLFAPFFKDDCVGGFPSQTFLP